MRKKLFIIIIIFLILIIPLIASGAYSKFQYQNIPAFDEKRIGGVFVVYIENDGVLEEVGKLSFDKYFREKRLDISNHISKNQPVKIVLRKIGGNGAHIDSILLNGIAPDRISVSGVDIKIDKVIRDDFDVIDATNDIKVEFSDVKDKALMSLTARIEEPVISKVPFQFPLSNLYKDINKASDFYKYKIGEGLKEKEKQIFQEYSITGSGHPYGYTYGWASNDEENLYLRIDFTPDNTMDNDKDYAIVYVKLGERIKEYKITEVYSKWGKTSFIHTDKADYEHKVYEFKIPFKDIGIDKENTKEIELAFSVYGTASPPGGDFGTLLKRYLIAYEKVGDIYGRFIDEKGEAVGDEFVISSAINNQYLPSVAYDTNSNRYLVVWCDSRNGNYDIYGQLINADGTLYGDSFPICNESHEQYKPSLAFNSSTNQYLVVWYDYRNIINADIYGQLVNSDGTLSGSNFPICDAPEEQYNPKVTYNSIINQYLVVWDDYRNNTDWNIWAQLVNADGTLQGGNFSVCNESHNQYNPSIAYDNNKNQYIIVWSDERNGNADIYGQLINNDGLLVNNNFSICNNTRTKYIPSIAYNAKTRLYLVVWHEYGGDADNIYGQYIDGEGILNGSNFMIVKNGMSPHNIANNEKGNFLLGYYDLNSMKYSWIIVGGSVELPETGQTKCYNSSGIEINCAGSGQDGKWRAGVEWPDPRFKDNGDGTITDNLTGLIWLINANCAGIKRTWDKAISDVASLNSAGIMNGNNCGDKSNSGSHQTDWRLPNINELESLINVGLDQTSAWLRSNGFEDVQDFSYWSSTNYNSTSGKWLVNFSSNYISYVPKSDEYFVLPVRSSEGGHVSLPRTGQTTKYESGDDGDLQKGVIWPNPRFVDNMDGTIKDNLTGLIWLKDASCFGQKDWITALNYINNLESGNCGLSDGSHAGDWRLPNIKELRSLVDYSKYNPVLPSGHLFESLQSQDYWSSTTYENVHYKAWFLNFQNGYVAPASKLDNKYVLPVRSGSNLSYDLFILKTGSGLGTIISEPSGIDCGSDCSEVYSQDTYITLNALADISSVFSSWSGDCSDCGVDSNCEITLNENKKCMADFTIKQNIITTIVNPIEGGSITCIPNPVSYGSNTTCTIITNSGYTLQSISGTCGGTLSGNVYSTNPITDSCTIEVNFNIVSSDYYKLKIIKEGTGDGLVTSSPKGIYCGSDCEEEYPKTGRLKIVTLKLKPDIYSTFLGWGGACTASGVKTSCKLKIDGDKEVRVNLGVDDIDIKPQEYDFGDVAVKKTSTEGVFEISNVGTGNLKVTKIKVLGDDAKMFKVKWSKKTIPSGGSYQFKVWFKPLSTGIKTATLQITTNDPDEQRVEIPLEGKGI